MNVDYIPPAQREKYSRELVGKDLMALVPPGMSTEQYRQQLAIKFKNVNTQP